MTTNSNYQQQNLKQKQKQSQYVKISGMQLTYYLKGTVYPPMLTLQNKFKINNLSFHFKLS